MKKITNQDGMIAVSAIVFGYLFYYQTVGVNYFIFTLMQLLFISWVSTKEIRTLKWWGVSIGVLFSATSALIYGSLLSAVGCIIGLILLSSITLNANTSVVIAFFHSFYSILTGFTFMLKQKLEKYADDSVDKNTAKTKKNVIIIVTTSLLGLVFFALYRQSNAQFKEWTDKIDLSFISVGWIFFTLMGYYFIYLLYKPFVINKIQDFDLNSSNDLTQKETVEDENSFLNTKTKLQWGVTILITLNTLLLAVNCTDVFYFLSKRDMATINFSEQVHQGIEALIFSIVLAIAVILYFFGGNLNFIKENKRLRHLAQLWMIQNALLIGFTAVRNVEYVEAFFLTYKRIGVFIYLVCCLIGLFYTFVKISRIKTNWFLVRKVSWATYFILMWTPLFYWDSFIINYNFDRAEANPKALDISYLMKLPKVNRTLIKERINQSKHVIAFTAEYVDGLNYEDENAENNEFIDWRSFNFRSNN